MASDRPDEATIFNMARRIDAVEERRAWLDKACAGDGEFRNRVEKLLVAFAEQSQFLEQPAEELQALLVQQNAENFSAALEAGLAPAFSENHAVVIGSAGHSVLQSLGNTIDLPRVALRESHAEGPDPITRPQSTEMPARDAHSRYQLQGEIARGGMGAILKGRDTDLGRDLAIKVLLDEHKTRPEVIQRFVEEAQIGGQLQHPGIAPVYELGQFSDKRPFFSMKLVKGQTFSKLLAERKDLTSDRGRFVGIFEQVCQTMAYAHSRGVIHRDLKPANIMVGAFGEVQVMDWGLAKVLSAGGVADEKKSHQKQSGQSIIQTLRSVGSDSPGTFGTLGSQTQMGSVMGTPAYMPPEQALGEIDHLDERADVFGLGAILCEILTDKPPYVADDGTLVFRMASRGKLEDCYQRLETCGADAELVALTKHCLELEPADRPRNAGVLAERITQYLESVQQKLHETELERAAQAARADAEAAQAAAERRRAEAESERAQAESRRAQAEAASAQAERKRRRTSLALAASVLLLVGLGSGGWLYLLRQEADRQTAEAAAQRQHAGEMQTLAEQRDQQRKAADQERNLARKAEEAMEKTATQATRDREIAERESYRSTIRLAESMLQGNEQARYGVANLLWETQPELRGWEWGYLMAQCPLEEWSLQTNQGGLVAMAASADGRFLATAGVDGSVALWETQSRKELWRQKNIATAVGYAPHLCIDPLARWVIVDFEKFTPPPFKILNVSDGTFVAEGPETRYSGIAFSVTGQELYLLKYDQLARYATNTWKPLASIRLSSFDDRSLFVDAAGAVVGVQDRIMYSGMEANRDRFSFLDSKSLQPIAALASLNTPVSRESSNADPVLDSRRGILLFDDNLKHAISRSLATTIQSTTSPIENSLDITGGIISHLAYDVRTDTTLVASQEGTVLVSDADRKTRTMAHGTPIRGMANLSDGHFVTGGSDGLIKCWTLRSPAPLGTNVTAAPTSATGEVADFTRDGNQLFFMSWEDWFCHLCDVNSLENHTMTTESLTAGDSFLGAIRPTTNEILVRNRGQVSLYAAKTGGLGEKTRSLPPIGWPRSALAFDAKGRLMVFLDQSGKVAVYDLNADRSLPVPDVPGTRFLGIAPSGTRAAVHTAHGLHVWDTSTGRLMNRLEIPAPPDSIYTGWHLCVNGYRPCFHPDEELVALFEDGDAHVSKIVIGDVSTGERRMEIVAEPGVQFLRFLFTPDGNRLVVPCSDSKVRIFDWRIGKELVALTNALVNLTLAVSPDGRSIAYGGHAPALRIAKALPRSVDTRPNEDFYTAVAELRHYSSQFVVSDSKVERAKGDSSLAVQAELLGDVLWHRGKTVEAIAQYAQAVKLIQQAIVSESDTQEHENRLAEIYSKWLAAVAPPTRADILQQAVDFWRELVARPKPLRISQHMLVHFQQALFNLRLTENQEAGVATLQNFIDYWLQQATARSDDRYAQGVLIALTIRLIDTDFNESVARFLCEGADKYPPGVAARIADRFLAKPEVAVSFCSSAISAQSNDAQLFFVRGQAHATLGRTDPAIEDLKRSLELQPIAPAASLLADLLLTQSSLQKWPAQFVRVGKENESSGLRLLENGITDSVTEPATISGQDCRQVFTESKVGRARNFGYAYFIIDDQFKSATKMDAILEMEYWDDGTGVFSIQYDTAAEVYRRSAEKQSLTGAKGWKTARFTLENARFANSQNGRADFRVEVEGEGLHLHRVSLQRIHRNIDTQDPWSKLAATYELSGDQSALAKLLEQQPAAAVGIGDIHLANQEWQRAIDFYDTLIKKGTKDANLLSHRAKAHVALEEWDLARADWLRAIGHDPGQLLSVFDICRRAERWSEAAEFGQMYARQNPKDSVRWIRVAPFLVLAGDRESSAAFCNWILAQPCEVFDFAEKAIKACLLRPGLVELSDLPSDLLVTALDEGTGPDWFPQFGWGTRALLAYRSGDPQSAVKYAAQSEELTRDDFVHAFNLAILALSHHELQHPDEARRSLEDASQLITRLQKNASYKGHHDLLIAEILYHEAEAKMAGKDVVATDVEPDSSASAKSKPLPTEPSDRTDPKKD